MGGRPSHGRMSPVLLTKNHRHVALGFILCVGTPGLKGFSTKRLKDWLGQTSDRKLDETS